jgi:hypothetical protein
VKEESLVGPKIRVLTTDNTILLNCNVRNYIDKHRALSSTLDINIQLQQASCKRQYTVIAQYPLELPQPTCLRPKKKFTLGR